MFFKCYLNSAPRLYNWLSIMRRISHILHPDVGPECLAGDQFGRVSSPIITGFFRFSSGATGLPEKNETGGDS